MFTYLFGGALAGSTREYLQYLLPGMLVHSVVFTAVYSGVALNTDVTKGVVDRFRSLAIWRPAPLVGAVLGDSVRYALAATVVIVLGVVMGFRPEAGVPGVLAAMLLVVVFTFGLSWAFTIVGLVMRSPSAVMNSGFHGPVPARLPEQHLRRARHAAGLARGVRRRQPDLHVTTATRGLIAGDASAGELALVLGEAAALTALLAPLTVRLYRERG